MVQQLVPGVFPLRNSPLRSPKNPNAEPDFGVTEAHQAELGLPTAHVLSLLLFHGTLKGRRSGSNWHLLHAPGMLPVPSGAAAGSAGSQLGLPCTVCRTPVLAVGRCLGARTLYSQCFPRTAAQGISSTAILLCCLSPVELCFPDVCAIFPSTLADFMHSQHPSARILPWMLCCPRGNLLLLLLQHGFQNLPLVPESCAGRE